MSEVIEIYDERCRSRRNRIDVAATCRNCQQERKLESAFEFPAYNGTPPWPRSIALSRESTRFFLLTRAAATVTSAAP